LRRNSEDYLTNPDLCYENVARFKRLVDSIQYNGPVVAMTDNTKLKSRLRYSPTLGCIIGSIFPIEETKINVYADIPNIINKIKNEKAIAKDVRAYILQVLLKIFKLLIKLFYYLNTKIDFLLKDSFTKIPAYYNCINTK